MLACDERFLETKGNRSSPGKCGHLEDSTVRIQPALAYAYREFPDSISKAASSATIRHLICMVAFIQPPTNDKGKKIS